MSDGGLLTLVQWLSPAFPVGAYAASHGLEWAMAGGEVGTAVELESWVATILAEGAGRTDAILLAHALRPDADPAALAALACALAASRERLAETMDQGRALLAVTNALTGQDHAAMPYPVALGTAARALGLAPGQVLGMYLQAFAATLVMAGVRFIPLGQTEGQQVLARLQPLVLKLAEKASVAGLNEIGTGTIRGDLAAMRHETMDVRIFRT